MMFLWRKIPRIQTNKPFLCRICRMGEERKMMYLGYNFLYPWHLCREVYSFRLSVHSSVCMSVHDSVLFAELLQSFTLKFLNWGISQQPLIRKHSYLDHRYPRGSAFIPSLLTLGSMPHGGARGQNLRHLKKVFFYFFFYRNNLRR